MGACASVPKGLKAGGASYGTEPERPKEETAAEESVELKAELEQEKEIVESNTEDDKSKNDVEVVSVNENGKLADDNQGETKKADSAAGTDSAEAAVIPPVKQEEGDKKVDHASPSCDVSSPKEEDERKSLEGAAKGEMTAEEELTGR